MSPLPPLSSEAIQALLPPGAAPVFIVAQTASTNDDVKSFALSGAAHGAAVIAERQTKGRGRRGRAFFSPPGGGLYMSLLLRPESLALSNPTHLTALAALRVCEAIESVCGLHPGIKWVNDIELYERKVGGILVEAVSNPAPDAAKAKANAVFVVGVGLNITAAYEDFPQHLRQRAGALYPPNEAPPEIRAALAAVILTRLAYAPPPDAAALFAAYKNKLTTLNRAVTVTQGADSYPAHALDIDADGRLLVRRADGAVALLSFQEVSVRSSTP